LLLLLLIEPSLHIQTQASIMESSSSRQAFLAGALAGGAVAAGAACWWFHRASSSALCNSSSTSKQPGQPVQLGQTSTSTSTSKQIGQPGHGRTSNRAEPPNQQQHHAAASLEQFDRDEVLAEQLTRNVQFFGVERQRAITHAFVVVIGLGVSRLVVEVASRRQPGGQLLS
jgi:hypothetical protein